MAGTTWPGPFFNHSVKHKPAVMKNQDLFVLDPNANNLLNDGVVEIVSSRDAAGQRIIRHELQTFVCEGEYQRGIYRILDTYLKHLDQPKQPAVWVSGFFGSGKSHLVKMLGFLWEEFSVRERRYGPVTETTAHRHQ